MPLSGDAYNYDQERVNIPITRLTRERTAEGIEDDVNEVETGGIASDDEDDPRPFRRVYLFGSDLSHLPPHLHYIVPTFGLFLFMCMYGYLQELVVYRLFERKWSNLQTFLHFFGVFICAEIQSFLHSTRHYSRQKAVPFLSMGTAPPSMAMWYYFLLTILKTLTMTFTNLSMTRINYPAKTMCKSALPIVTMTIGLFWFRKSYPLRDYLVAILLVSGLYLFIAVDAANSPSGTGIGLFFVILSLIGAALIPMVQEHIMDTYEATSEELLYFSFLGSTGMSFVFTFLSGEAVDGTAFLLSKGSIFMWLCFTAFNICGFLGAACSIALTARFGSVVNAITNTSRKAISIALSFVMFPERNSLHTQHVVGAFVFFAGLIVRGTMKVDKEQKTKRRRSTNAFMNISSDNLEDDDSLRLGTPSKSKWNSPSVPYTRSNSVISSSSPSVIQQSNRSNGFNGGVVMI